MKKMIKRHKLVLKLLKKNLKLLVTKIDKLVENIYITAQKLVNLNNQISKVITKSKYLDKDAGLRPNHYHYIEIHQAAAQFDYILHEIGNRVRGWQWT